MLYYSKVLNNRAGEAGTGQIKEGSMRKIKSIVIAAFALALAAFVLAGCSSNASSSAASSASASSASAQSETKTLIVGFDQEFPPYGYVGNDGEYTGVDLDLAKEVADRNGWEFEAMPIDWDSKDAMLNAGTINAIWNGFTIEGREDDYTFSDPYMLNEQVLVVKNGSDVTSLEDLAGKTVMTQADSAGLELLTDEEGDYAAITATFAGGEPQTLGDYNNIFMQLDSGMVDAVVCDSSVAGVFTAADPDKYVVVMPLSSEHFGVGFKKGDDATAKQVTETLKEMYADGTVEQILSKYADQNVTIENWILK